MKYKKTVQQRRIKIKVPDSWETHYTEVRGLNKLIDSKPIKQLRSNQLRTYYRRKLDGLGLNAAKLRNDCMIDMLAGIALGALDECLLYDGDDTRI